MPGPTPVTEPVVELIVAVVVGIMLHVPPVDPSVSAIESEAQTDEGPPIAEGEAFTVTIVVAVQPPAV